MSNNSNHNPTKTNGGRFVPASQSSGSYVPPKTIPSSGNGKGGK